MLKLEFERLVQVRLHEARLLLAGQAFDGCYYFTGLAVEAALKACIAKATRRHEFPDRDRAYRAFTHDLGRLLREAELEEKMREESLDLRRNWGLMLAWKIEARYAVGRSRDDAEALVHAAAGRGGIIPWVKKHW